MDAAYPLTAGCMLPCLFSLIISDCTANFCHVYLIHWLHHAVEQLHAFCMEILPRAILLWQHHIVQEQLLSFCAELMPQTCDTLATSDCGKNACHSVQNSCHGPFILWQHQVVERLSLLACNVSSTAARHKCLTLHILLIIQSIHLNQFVQAHMYWNGKGLLSFCCGIL